MIYRDLEKSITKAIKPGKAVILYGARRVGKTVLMENIVKHQTGKTMLLNGEDFATQNLFKERTATNYRQILTGVDLLVIDEAQNIPQIGHVIKFITDHVKHVAVLASGSSSFDLQNQVGEPLVGRASTFFLYPFSLHELSEHENRIESIQRLEERLVYGTFPELSSIPDFFDKQNYLHEIAVSYLLKDILTVDGIKNSSKMRDLLRLVAYQVGNLVSYDELAKQLSLSRNTVEKYLDLLTKTFIIYRLPAFQRNHRKEVTKAGKWFFVDNGIRNALIGDFRPVSLRQDVGVLWENFVISERIKQASNNRKIVQFYFWRTYAGQEIDLIEEENAGLRAFECKWTEKKVKNPSVFKETYSHASFNLIHKTNFLDFLI
ncbi:MAG: ATP-binding protein [Bacteroidales bacterium]|nr:ATP-binding protein [Bacteroidales bacterium]